MSEADSRADAQGAERQPAALRYLFFAEAWERFSFYGMKALLVFYMTKRFAFGDEQAYAVYGSYTALVYATPVLGGMLADRVLGFRKAVVLGAVLMALGHFAMTVERVDVFYLALGLLICGNGFFKPNISSIVGRLYRPDDPRRDAGFSIFYMGINLGAGLAGIVCGNLGERFGWHWGFGVAGLGMLVGLGVFLRAQPLLAGLAEPPDRDKLAARRFGLSREAWIYVGVFAAVLLAWRLVEQTKLVGVLLSVFGGVVLLGLVIMLARMESKLERERLYAALFLTLVSVVFWAFFEQAGTSMNLFTDRNVNRSVFGVSIPASVFQSVNPAFILLLAPPLTTLWLLLGRRGREPSSTLKFALGILQLGLGFGALYFGALTSQKTGIVPLPWLLLGYLLHTMGELCLSPVGLSLMTKLSPVKTTGLMMGVWFLSTAFAQYAASMIAAFTGVSGEGKALHALPAARDTVMVYGTVFGNIAVVALVVGVLVALSAPFVRRWMHGVR
ncbi:MAG TPA: peptide MFS transporter [Polyangiaceae bacterium]